MTTRVGIVGLGFVGGALYNAIAGNPWSDYLPVACDTDPAKQADTARVEELVDFGCELIFLCLPTPMRADGSCNWELLEKTVRRIESAEMSAPFTVVIKSTIPPGTTHRLQDIAPRVNLVFNPEFLTEARANQDFLDQRYYLLGAPRGHTVMGPVLRFYSSILPSAVAMIGETAEAVEMAKYVTNVFLAMKVTFANEIERLCVQMGVSYPMVASMLKLDHRLGTTHWTVPGPDGLRGFGGSCFPKDLKGLIYEAGEAECPTSLMETIWHENLINRGEADWNRLKGRAVE